MLYFQRDKTPQKKDYIGYNANTKKIKTERSMSKPVTL